MPVGMRIRDRISGKITLDLTDRITRKIGEFNTGTSNGFFDVPSFPGDIYYYCIQSARFPAYAPGVSLVGRRISWAFNSPSGMSGTRVPVTIVYGAF